MVVCNFDHRFLSLKYGTPFDSLVNHWLPRSRKPDNVGGKCWFQCHVFVLLVYKNITMFWWKKTSCFAGYMNTNSMNMVVYYRSFFFNWPARTPIRMASVSPGGMLWCFILHIQLDVATTFGRFSLVILVGGGWNHGILWLSRKLGME